VSDLGRDKLPTLVDITWQILFRLGFPVARIWWRLQRRRHVGALVAIHVGQSLLLLRSSYRSAWNFPGGSVRQGETPEVSVRRELAEEIGLVANAPLQLVGEVCGVWDGRIDRVFLFVLRLDRLPTLQLDNREIIGAQFVPIDDLHKVPLTGPVQAYVRGQFSPNLSHDPHRHHAHAFEAIAATLPLDSVGYEPQLNAKGEARSNRRARSAEMTASSRPR